MDPAVLDDGSRPERWDQEAEGIVRLLARLGRILEIPGRPPAVAARRVEDEIAAHAACRRREGRLDQADRMIGASKAPARRLAREFPDDPHPHGMLCRAFLQRSRNAGKRQDVGAVRRELARSVEELERTVSLGPENDWLRDNLRDKKAQLVILDS